MPKGFGVKSEQLGYVLLLYPEASAYAARQSIETPEGEPFIGVTNMLEDAHCWKKQRDAQAAIDLYGSFISDLLEEKGEAIVRIQRLERSPDGSLHTEMMRELKFFTN